MKYRSSLGLVVLATVALSQGCAEPEPGAGNAMAEAGGLGVDDRDGDTADADPGARGDGGGDDGVSDAGGDDGVASEGSQSAASEYPASGSLWVDQVAEAVRRHDEAKARLAADPVVEPAVARFLVHRSKYGLSADDTFRVRSVVTDPRGGKHARLDHYHEGLRVVGSRGVVRTDKDGATLEERTKGIRRDIDVDTTPRLAEQDVRAVVDLLPERTGTPLIEPRVELVIFPVKKRFVKATGAEVTGAEEELNAVDVEQRVIAYKLAYQVETLDRGRGGPESAYRYILDATTGEVLQKTSSSHGATGTGHTYRNPGPWEDYHVDVTTYYHSSDSPVWWEPKDAFRNFGVWDDDYSLSGGPNKDLNNLWGDGQVFMGDATATNQNRQTAIADVLYGMQGAWDLYDNVWNRQGYDDDFYAGHAFVHVDTEWNDAYYNGFTGNITVGDGSGSNTSLRTSYDVIGHEFGHGVNDFTAEIWGGAEAEGLKEANSDILGEVSEAYERGGALLFGLNYIPELPGPDWKMTATGRDFKAPRTPYWSTALANFSSEYDRMLPMIHAFYFLARGALSDPLYTTWSQYLPWGMTGVGVDKAARIWMLALLTGFNEDQDYADARESCLFAASFLYGSGSYQYQAVQNAFAAINVGAPASGYPGAPVSQGETEPNDAELLADAIANGTLPAGAPVVGPLLKRTKVTGSVWSTDTSDWYFINVPSGQHVRATLRPMHNADLEIRDIWETQIGVSNAIGTNPDQVLATAPSDGQSHYYAIRVYYVSSAFANQPLYSLYVDLY